jgi:hypothetical protein
MQSILNAMQLRSEESLRKVKLCHFGPKRHQHIKRYNYFMLLSNTVTYKRLNFIVRNE